MSLRFTISQTHVLLATNLNSAVLPYILAYLIKHNAIVTLQTPYPCPLPLSRQRGEFGYVPRLTTVEDLDDFSWVIVVGRGEWRQKIVDECRFKRRILSVWGDLDGSDLDLEAVIEFNGDFEECEEYKESGESVVELDTEVVPAVDAIDINSVTDISTNGHINESKNKHELIKPTTISTPKLYLVGAGPGSPDLLTIKAHSLIHSTPVIISDRLIDPRIFEKVPSKTRILFSRKVCGKAQEAQDEINAWILENLTNGKSVVRVKSGDPFVFGRGGEEALLVQQHGYEFEVVPGISSCIAAAGVAGIPVTHRGISDSFIVSTGQRRDGSWAGVPNYRPNTTVVLLMATGVLNKLVFQFVNQLGYPKGLSVAVVYRATYKDQLVIKGTLETISALVKEKDINNHSTVILGHVVNCLFVNKP